MVTSLIVRRAIRVEGRKTSVSLEGAFWSSLKEIAELYGARLPDLVSSINENRGRYNLSSAIRLFVLRHYWPEAERYDAVPVSRQTIAGAATATPQPRARLSFAQ